MDPTPKSDKNPNLIVKNSSLYKLDLTVAPNSLSKILGAVPIVSWLSGLPPKLNIIYDIINVFEFCAYDSL